MTLIDIVLVFVIVGLVMWLINAFIPMAAGIKSLLNVVVFVVVLIWVLRIFGVVGEIPGVHIPRLM
ncbi:MAG: Thivi_2564 family membrane protein [Candidatus Binataceae bacterium]